VLKRNGQPAILAGKQRLKTAHPFNLRIVPCYD
jgi:hypothetical protein